MDKILGEALEILAEEYIQRTGNEIYLDDFPAYTHRNLLNQLLCIRPPVENEQLFEKIDYILSTESKKRSILDANKIFGNQYANKYSIYSGDITKLAVDFITNAANSELLGCFQPSHKCIDNVIHTFAGPRLRLACMNHGPDDGRVGNAFVTPAYSLPCQYVIHTVGPQITQKRLPTLKEQEQLASCYIQSLERVKSSGIQNPSIAFCCISTGLYGFDQELASKIAVDTTLNYINENKLEGWHIIFNVFTQKDQEFYENQFLRQFGAAYVYRDTFDDQLHQAIEAIKNADYLLISGAAGLSASAGIDYTSETVFKEYFPVMHQKGFKKFYEFIGFNDWERYSNNPEGLKWGYYLDQVNLVRYNWPRAKVYQDLLKIFEKFGSENSFVATSNADGMFEQNGFPLDSIYTIQGEYGKLQCFNKCRLDSVWPTKPFIDSILPHLNRKTQEIPPNLVPKCQNCGGPLMLNVRGGDWFNDKPYEQQQARFNTWKNSVMDKVKHENKKLVILEIGAGFNTPSVLRWPNEKLAKNDRVLLCRINMMEEVVDTNYCAIGLDAADALSKISSCI
ncbi:hypothetical protein HDV06_003916 [Boothiomyces sp. JEL0866]|nr:hypothetical protein HDV06_003916 [Boothiomyces sp. JEL0866]